MNADTLIWKIFVDDKVIHYQCAACEWNREYLYPFAHNQKTAERTLNSHLKVCTGKNIISGQPAASSAAA